jgi:hypothetical protein
MIMPAPDDPVEPAATELSFDLEVHNGMTKKSFRIKEGGTLKIRNKSPDAELLIESDDDPPPFDVPGFPCPRRAFTVAAHSTLRVGISAAYVAGMRFTYRSTIQGSTPEDPIVIIERR